MAMSFKRMAVLLGVTCLAGCVTPPPAPGCDRACLGAIRDDYLAAMVARDPARAPMAADYRVTQDGQQIALGDGLWRTATGLGSYRIDFADPTSGNVGSIVEVREGEGAVTIALRLKVEDRTITEVESVLGRGRVPGSSPEPAPRASLARTVPVAQRLSRAEMIATADANFDAILAADGSIYADDCQRVENRMAMSGNDALDYPIGDVPGVAKPRFGSMGCAEQISRNLMGQLDSVEPRRFVLVDEEKQLVFGVYMMKWYGKGDPCTEIGGYGRVCHETVRQPTALLNAELLGVKGGMIHEIEAIFQFVPYDADSGWDGDLRTAGNGS